MACGRQSARAVRSRSCGCRFSTIADGTVAAPMSAYRVLPAPDGYAFQNRFIGDFEFYGIGSGLGAPRGPRGWTSDGASLKGGDPSSCPFPTPSIASSRWVPTAP